MMEERNNSHPVPEFLKACVSHPYSDSVCFMCACDLTADIRSEEHVIPKWLQAKYDLWDQKLTLTNGTAIPYRRLTIPCCKGCNLKYSELEQYMKSAIEKGENAVRRLHPVHVIQWLAKIYLGLSYKELFLDFDRTDPQKGAIVSSELIKRYSLLHLWLAMRYNETWKGPCPGSLFIVPTTHYQDYSADFDLLDNWEAGTIAMRMGSVGLIAQFLDFGVHQRAMEDLVQEMCSQPHDHIQFRELAAKVFYKAMLLDFESDYYFTENETGVLQGVITWRAGARSDCLFGDWDQKTYALVLSHYIGIPFEDLYVEPGLVWTTCPWHMTSDRLCSSAND